MRKREEGRGMIHQGCGFGGDLALVLPCGEPWRRTALPHGILPWAKGVELLFLSPCQSLATEFGGMAGQAWCSSRHLCTRWFKKPRSIRTGASHQLENPQQLGTLTSYLQQLLYRVCEPKGLVAQNLYFLLITKAYWFVWFCFLCMQCFWNYPAEERSGSVTNTVHSANCPRNISSCLLPYSQVPASV